MTNIKVIGLLCALGLSGGVSLAQAAQNEIQFFARSDIQAWHGQRFTVITIDSLDRFDGLRAMLENWTSSYPDKVDALQQSIVTNRSLASALRSRNVQINNVVAIQKAFSGNLVFYLR